jgi:hypothetical protein
MAICRCADKVWSCVRVADDCFFQLSIANVDFGGVCSGGVCMVAFGAASPSSSTLI